MGSLEHFLARVFLQLKNGHFGTIFDKNYLAVEKWLFWHNSQITGYVWQMLRRHFIDPWIKQKHANWSRASDPRDLGKFQAVISTYLVGTTCVCRIRISVVCTHTYVPCVPTIPWVLIQHM